MATKVGMIGAGEVAGVHAAILARDPRVAIAHVYDRTDERARALAGRYGARAAGSLEGLLEGSDAVYVCTPNRTHVEMAVKALRAGKPTFCEKPFALDLEGARAVRDAARRSGVVFQLGHNRRFAPVYKALKQAITEGALQPLSVHAKMNRGELLNPGWVGDAKVTGGFLYETPVHMFDLMGFFFGEVDWVEVAARAHQGGELDDFSILLSFESGVQATMKTFAHAGWHFPFERLEVYGLHATYETFEMERIAFTAGLEKETTTLDFGPRLRDQKWGYVEEDALFVNALEGRGESPVTADDGYRVVELIESCYQSARTGRRVKVGEGVRARS